MSDGGVDRSRAGVCADCARRSWLLAELGGPLDCVSADRGRLLEALALDDEALLRALAGRRRAELRARYAALGEARPRRGHGVEVICRHDERFPAALRSRSAPHVVHAAPSAQRLQALAREPCVALLGGRRASDYGLEVARGLARDLAAVGVVLVSALEPGIAAAAGAAAIEAGGAVVWVIPGGLDEAVPPRRRALYGRIQRHGATLSELPCGSPPRRWAKAASPRIVAGFARLSVLVEAEHNRHELAPAQVASALGRQLAAVPGRITSPFSRGPNALLAQGATPICGTADVLELLRACGGEPHSRGGEQPVRGERARRAPDPHLERVLERVAGGCDTPERLRRDGEDMSSLLEALSELELIGLLARGDGGRYVPRADSRAARADLDA